MGISSANRRLAGLTAAVARFTDIRYFMSIRIGGGHAFWRALVNKTAQMNLIGRQ